MALPTTARAQTIFGVAKDTSGGVLPGVTVEVSSPALIEGTKSATTDGEGNYRIVDLRPGQYTIKFTLTGFATFERAAVPILSDSNNRIDGELKVGAIAETITVTGAAPIVDVQSAARVAVLDRDALDNIPTGKGLPALGQLVLGVSLNGPDVGGSAGAMNTYMSLHGTTVSAANNTVMVDGMVINGLMLDGAVQTYTNDGDFQEMTYQTAGIDASRSGGGVTVNLVPKEGGNRFSGASTAVYRPDYLQGSNYSDRLKLWGLPQQRNPQKDPVAGPFTGPGAVNRIKRISDVQGSEGGPIMKDKLWFFVSGRDNQPINFVPNTFLDDGTQGIDDNFIRNTLVRLTYQMSPKHKFSAYYERVFKWRGHDMGSFDDPETVAIVWTSPNYSTFSAKYTGTISSKLLVEGGFSQNTELYRNKLLNAVDKPRPGNESVFNCLAAGAQIAGQAAGQLQTLNTCAAGSAAAFYQTEPWYATANHSGGGFSGVSAAGSSYQWPVSRVWQASASYVTGAHHARLGFQYKYGEFGHGGDNNADLTVAYGSGARQAADVTLPTGEFVGGNYNIYFPTSTLGANQFAYLFPLLATRPCAQGTPTATAASQSVCSATIRNSPRQYGEALNYDIGMFAQDSYTIKRLTINAGLRFEMFNSEVSLSTSGAGRFVPVRNLLRTNLPQSGLNIPNWRDWAPRFQLVYDVFGDSKTAVKFSWNRYNEANTTSTASGFNPVALSTSGRPWTDMNGDDIAQGGVTYLTFPQTTNAVNLGTAAAPLYRHVCIYLTPGCEINMSGYSAPTGAFTYLRPAVYIDPTYSTLNGGTAGNGTSTSNTGTGGATATLSPSYGLITDAGAYTQYPRRYHTEFGFELSHALLPRLSLNATYYRGSYHNFSETVNWNRAEMSSTLGTAAAQYSPFTVFSPVDGLPQLNWLGTGVASLTTSDNHSQQDTVRKQSYDSYAAEFRMRPYAGAQLSGGINFERTMNFTCGNNQTRKIEDAGTTATWQNAPGGGDRTPAVSDPSTFRFCDDWNRVGWGGQVSGAGVASVLTTATTIIGSNGLVVGATPGVGKRFTKDFKLSGAFPIVYGMNFGISYQNLDAGGLAPAFLMGGPAVGTAFVPGCVSGTSRCFYYPDGTATFTSLNKTTTLPACPNTYGCVPGGVTTTADLGAAGTSIGSFDANGYSDDRQVQLDLKVSKNFRFGRVSIVPTIDAFNIMNIDQIRGRASSSYGNNAGNYQNPSTVLQGRIIGFGANVKW